MYQLQAGLPTGTTTRWHSSDSWKQQGVGCGAENQFPGSHQQLGSGPLTWGQENRVKVLFPGSQGLPHTHASLLAQCAPSPEPSAPTVAFCGHCFVVMARLGYFSIRTRLTAPGQVGLRQNKAAVASQQDCYRHKKIEP